jgi:hypothetical protein
MALWQMWINSDYHHNHISLCDISAYTAQEADPRVFPDEVNNLYSIV